LSILMNIGNKKTILRQVGEGTFWYVLSSILMKFFAIITVSVTLVSLTVYEYGLAELVLSLIALGSIVLLPGYADTVMADASVCYGRGDLNGARSIITSYLITHSAGALIGYGVFYAASSFFAVHYNAHISELIRIAGLSYLFAPVRSVFGVLATTLLQFRLPSIASFAEEALRCLLIFILVYYYKLGVIGFLWARVGSQFLTNIVVFPWVVVWFRRLRTGGVSIVGEHSQRSIFSWRAFHSISISYLGVFNQNIRLFFIKLLAGTEVVGLFAAAVGLFSHITALFPLHRVSSALLPRYVNNMSQFMKIVSKTIKYQVATYVVLALGAFILAEPFLSYFFPTYVASIPFFNIMLLAIPPTAFGIVTSIFYIFKLERQLSVFTLVRSVSIILLLPICVYFFGTIGVAIEFVITTWLFVVLRNLFLKKYVSGFVMLLRDLVFFDDYDKMLVKKILLRIGINQTT
jgi:O-antigen/teichoic acid export membrane protein